MIHVMGIWWVDCRDLSVQVLNRCGKRGGGCVEFVLVDLAFHYFVVDEGVKIY